jgi:hypothetical protein
MNISEGNIGGYFLLFTSILVLYTSYYGSILERPTIFLKGIDIFSKFSVIFIAFGIFMTYIYYRQNLSETRRTNTFRIIENGYLDTTKLINSLYSKCPKFCNSLYYTWQQEGLIVDKNIKDDWMSTHTIAMTIFHRIELIIDAQGVDNSSFDEWCGLFIQWLHGPQIQKIWKSSWHNLSDLTTVPFINIFIDFINTNKSPKNSKEVEEMAHKISTHPEIQRLIHIT